MKSRLRSPWAIPGFILSGVGGFFWLVDTLGNIEWVVDLAENPRAQKVWQFVQTPVGGLLVFAIGIAWLVVCARMPLPTSASVASNGTTPAERAAENEPQPNVVVVETRSIYVQIEGNGLIKESSFGGITGAVIVFRNDAVGGRRIGSLNNARAHLTVKPAGANPFTVHSGYWLDYEFNTVDIGPGEAHTLLVALKTGEAGQLVIPEDRRESVDRYDAPKGIRVDAKKATIEVKLVGGWDGQHVQKFSVAVSQEPMLTISRRS